MTGELTTSFREFKRKEEFANKVAFAAYLNSLRSPALVGYFRPHHDDLIKHLKKLKPEARFQILAHDDQSLQTEELNLDRAIIPFVLSKLDMEQKREVLLRIHKALKPEAFIAIADYVSTHASNLPTLHELSELMHETNFTPFLYTRYNSLIEGQARVNLVHPVVIVTGHKP